jgi:hypothetical protein
VRVTQFGRFQFDVVEEFLQVLVVSLIRSFFTLVTIGLLVGLTPRHLGVVRQYLFQLIAATLFPLLFDHLYLLLHPVVSVITLCQNVVVFFFISYRLRQRSIAAFGFYCRLSIS